MSTAMDLNGELLLTEIFTTGSMTHRGGTLHYCPLSISLFGAPIIYCIHRVITTPRSSLDSSHLDHADIIQPNTTSNPVTPQPR